MPEALPGDIPGSVPARAYLLRAECFRSKLQTWKKRAEPLAPVRLHHTFLPPRRGKGAPFTASCPAVALSCVAPVATDWVTRRLGDHCKVSTGPQLVGFERTCVVSSFKERPPGVQPCMAGVLFVWGKSGLP